METKTRGALVGLVAATVLGFAGPAHASPVNEGGDTQPCVTMAEFNAVFLGMPRHRAERIMDTRGQRVTRGAMRDALSLVGMTLHQVGGRGHVYVRTYPGCTYENGRRNRVVIAYNPRRPGDRVTAAAFI